MTSIEVIPAATNGKLIWHLTLVLDTKLTLQKYKDATVTSGGEPLAPVNPVPVMVTA
jgi:hypothetical protein